MLTTMQVSNSNDGSTAKHQQSFLFGYTKREETH